MRRGPRCARGLALLCLVALASGPVFAAAKLNTAVPSFNLEMLNGRSFSSQTLRGKRSILIVGQTQKSAPPCREWSLALLKALGPGLQLYQIIVVDKSWYIPKGAVRSKVRGFTPESVHHRVLLEWYRVVADSFGLERHDDPELFLLDANTTLRYHYRGNMTVSQLQDVLKAYQRWR